MVWASPGAWPGSCAGRWPGDADHVRPDPGPLRLGVPRRLPCPSRSRAAVAVAPGLCARTAVLLDRSQCPLPRHHAPSSGVHHAAAPGSGSACAAETPAAAPPRWMVVRPGRRTCLASPDLDRILPGAPVADALVRRRLLHTCTPDGALS